MAVVLEPFGMTVCERCDCKQQQLGFCCFFCPVETNNEMDTEFKILAQWFNDFFVFVLLRC